MRREEHVPKSQKLHCSYLLQGKRSYGPTRVNPFPLLGNPIEVMTPGLEQNEDQLPTTRHERKPCAASS